MIKKLDKLVLQAFYGPFIITLSVLVFIFLIQFLIMTFDQLIGKNLSIGVLGELIFCFSLNMVPNAMPLALLLSSLITFGTLGEHSELTAIKSAGISLPRIISPVLVVVILISCGMLWFNNTVLPWANLKAYSLLYDIKTKKATFSIKPGIFYYGLPGYAIKVNDVADDGVGIKKVIIYDHTDGMGNRKVTLADSGKMYTILNDRYLVLELFSGTNYSELIQQGSTGSGTEFSRNNFRKSKIVFSLSSFDLSRTNEGLFSTHHYMRNIPQLVKDVDSLQREEVRSTANFQNNFMTYYLYQNRRLSTDTAFSKPASFPPISSQMKATYEKQMAYALEDRKTIIYIAANQARNIKSYTRNFNDHLLNVKRDTSAYSLQLHKKFNVPVACLVLFLIGASLGTIIKKGGLGVPVLVSIIFFIVFYILTIMGEKWVKELVVQPVYGMWAANVVLFFIGLYFLKEARRDASLFDLNLWQRIVNNLDDLFSAIKNIRKRKIDAA